ncbi:hypothetical protein EVB32_004 [Rhizobium phage RHph_TM39]|uniref:Uncharacterized protein n=2 Tax=Cuauhnahuacvirus TaxID=3044696 RepID=A0A7S5R7T0_9CAUD|nr:hypothetical protein PQC16_gp004 [Rhizobium phage RHph_TM30]YP_010671153.1 hypothetical protein PQC17_gp004 [Rhizobium phage RHph_Y65]QIG71475.1 hypothetical protein EVB94_004 [Rhizobium phage RHph_TM40]QIG71838.1 hypothetical protein EVB95_004 [Rhizobium phage RHph_TM2_3B]QIG72200.1 hypothetical protein EVB96_004 [Rhizobium phage RHph_TM3_3_6]QIG76992.1 hypothetical protein EVB32_004 [Rhizobium phage RHph_TM39]QIG77332.1 hypothetical protein EVB61_004 [Rhizobium phage RHph_TM21B]QIG77591
MKYHLEIFSFINDRDRLKRDNPLLPAGPVLKGETLYTIRDIVSDRYFNWCYIHQHSAEFIMKKMMENWEAHPEMVERNLKSSFLPTYQKSVHSTRTPSELEATFHETD